MKLIRKRFLLKAFAVFFLLEIITSTVAPAVSWALTAGPTAPEATSFEPIDTTDMVNLTTGDLAYTMPLLEVPGPAGGYPLALSYHAGIMPQEDASFVGLGFTLNPGAINRSVSGYADDAHNVNSSTHTFWEGGNTETMSIGVNISTAGGAGVSAGLVFSDDTYKGSGTGYYYGFSAQSKTSLGKGIGVNGSASYSAGVSPYGDSFSSTGASVGIGMTGKSGFSASSKASVAFDKDGNASGNLSATGGYSMIGASISTSQSSVSISAGGVAASATSTNVGNVSTTSSDFSVDIPVSAALSISLGYSYQRYWIDEIDNVSMNGALYFPTSSTLPTTAELDKQAYDVYDLADAFKPNEDIAPDQGMMGSFIDYDNFSVLAQGLAGTMRPYHYMTGMLRRNRKANNVPQVKSYPLLPTAKPHFRFIGDFSNRFEHSLASDDFTVNSANTANPLSFAFSSSRNVGESGHEAYDIAENFLPGSKNIEWFTNTSIRYKPKDAQGNPVSIPTDAAVKQGFIDCKAEGFQRAQNDKIGGFMITNESGVTYHYALPVYSFEEHQYSGKIDDAGKHTFNNYDNPEPYAYTWLLTGVTGPDFVDTNGNGYADKGDYGYWVTFHYGKWSGNYDWRNPGEGTNKDLDQNFDVFSKGKKEIYYINYIATQTHTAFFVKGIRYDGKSAVPEFAGAIKEGNARDIDDGDFNPRGTQYPTSTLKLKRIYLMQNTDFSSASDFLTGLCNKGARQPSTQPYMARENVLDSLDLTGTAEQELLTKAVKSIELMTDYSLSRGTANSYISPSDVYQTGLTASTNRRGKLTLKEIKIYGKNNVSLLPPTRFNYEIESEEIPALIKGTPLPENPITRAYFPDADKHGFEVGDLLTYKNGATNCCSRIDAIYSDYLALTIISGASRTDFNAVIRKTKNPPYSADRYDMWNMYKSDWVEGESENVMRMVTSISAKSLDVWSLREITSPLGATIKLTYEPDRYQNSLKSLSNIPVKSIRKVGMNESEITLYQNVDEYGLKPDVDPIQMRFVTALKYRVRNADELDQLRFDCKDVDYSYFYYWHYDSEYDITYDQNGNEGGRKIGIRSIDKNTFRVMYDVTMGFPKGPGLCVKEAFPYAFQDGMNQNGCIGFEYLELEEQEFLGGEIITNKVFSPHGGGIRVKKVSLVRDDLTRSTLYDYANGLTTYEPLGYAIPLRKIPASEIYDCLEDKQQEVFNRYRGQYLRSINKKFRFLFANARELPGPNVMYGLVTVREQIERPEGTVMLPGRTEYEFEVFSPEKIGTEGVNKGLVDAVNKQYVVDLLGSNEHTYTGVPTKVGVSVEGIRTSTTTMIKDFSSIMGSLKRTTLYDQDNNKISETRNQYLHDDFEETSFLRKLGDKNNQGVISETFAEARAIRKADNSNKYTLLGIVSQKIKYPSVQTGTTTVNYKTGITTTSTNVGFDFYSGNVTKVLTTDGYGNVYLQVATPAYRIYGDLYGGVYGKGMGPAGFGGKNMLVQEAQSRTYKVNPADHTQYLGLLSASVQTWNDDLNVLQPGQGESSARPQPGMWRMHANYSYIGKSDVGLQPDGLYPVAQISGFNAWDIYDTPGDDWQKDSELTLYDVYSHGLEARDLNDRYVTTKMSSDQVQVLATGTNAAYREIAYAGAEDTLRADRQLGGGVFCDGTIQYQAAHTGRKSVKPASNGRAFTYYMVPRERTYRVSVWTSGGTPQIKFKFDNVFNPENTAGIRAAGTAGVWALWEADIAIEGSYDRLEVWCQSANGAVLFDDFRIQPVDAEMTAFVYNKSGEVSHILDGNNLYTKYEYDAHGRLVATRKESFQPYGKQGIVQLNTIQYQYSPVAVPITVTLSSSSAGINSSILPSGNVTIAQGGIQIYTVRGTCSGYNGLRSVVIDGNPIDLTKSETVLVDGTRVQVALPVITFKNVRANHTIAANFDRYPEPGRVLCTVVKEGPFNRECYNGHYFYAYYNDCGELGPEFYVMTHTDVPADLRHLAYVDCCINNDLECSCQRTN